MHESGIPRNRIKFKNNNRNNKKTFLPQIKNLYSGYRFLTYNRYKLFLYLFINFFISKRRELYNKMHKPLE